MLFIILGIVAVVALGIFVAGFVSASPGEIKVISGPRGQRVIQGKTGWKMPVLERVDKMTAGMISVDARTTDFVPTNDYINVKVDAAVKVKIGTEKPELFKSATRNFLYKSQSEIADEVRDTLEGHLRAIIGQMKLAEIVTDRATFSEKVQDNATKDLEEMGLEIVAFNIQGLIDEKGVIENLGIDNTEQIRKDAAIAKARAQQEIAQQQAASNKLANDAQVQAELEIAQKQTELAKRQAVLKAEADTEAAKADSAYDIQKQIQRKDVERVTAEADIVKQEQEGEVKAREVEVRRQSLEAEVKVKADAERYATEQAAQADLFSRQRAIDAETYRRTQEAKANKEAMLAEAEGIKAKGQAEADAVQAKLLAEAEGLERKAEAMAKMNQAYVLEMYFNALPAVAEAVAAPLNNIGSITMYGEGNSAKMVEDITKSMTQVQSGLGDAVGLDVKQLINTLVGVKAGGREYVNSMETVDALQEAIDKPHED